MEIKAVREGVYEDRAGFPRQYGPERSDHQPGIPFWPHEVYRDLVITFLLVAILFFLSAFATPLVGPSANPAVQPYSVPDWYLLFSWGLLKIADLFPVIHVPENFGGGTLIGTEIDAAVWGDLLTAIPVIPIFLLPFIDRGRETRPAKSPFRAAGGMYMIAFVFFASVYAANDRIIATWPFIHDDTLKWLFVVPPTLVLVASYVGIRRLGFRDMYWWIVASLGASFAIVSLVAAQVFVLGPWAADGIDPLTRLAMLPNNPAAHPLFAFMIIVLAYTGIVFFAAVALRERKAKQWVLFWSLFFFFLAVGLVKFFADTNPAGVGVALEVIAYHGNWFIAFPLFSLITYYVGTRTPYSTYEYLLNECYQCGKCHTVCPVTKVEDDALGGLNLVYNTFKKQHDGVPLWTCLACDACSAVCPLDIKYSDYILEERSKVMARPMAADGGRRSAE